MKELNFYLKVLGRFLKRYLAYMVGFLICIILIAGWFYLAGKNNVKETISEGVVGTYTEADLPEVVTSLLSRSLVNLDSSGQPIGDLAETWEVLENAKEYKVTLKKNQKWLDNQNINAADLAVSIPDASVEVIDEQTLKFKLIDSFSPFITLLDEPVLRKDSTIGTGPYQISDVERSTVFIKKMLLKTNDPNLPNVIIRFYPNERVAKQALQIGEVQALLGVNESDDLVTQAPFKLKEQNNFNRVVTIFYNTKDSILSDENFRLALSFAAPVIPGEVEATSSIIPSSWAFNPNVKNYLDNANMAKNYLGRVKNGKDSTITLVSTSSLEDIGQRVVDAWNSQGIKATLQVESGIPQTFQALLISQNIPMDPDQYSLWHSTQSKTNISGIALPRLDKALEDGRKEVDLEKRKDIYEDFQKVLLDHAPATFLYFPKTKIVFLSKIEEPLAKVLELQKGSF